MSGLYLGLSAVDHACQPNANVVFKGRTAELRAMQPLADFSSCRISYIAEMLPTPDRQRMLREQYYFSCDCPYCAVEVSAGSQPASGLLRCTGCSVPVPYQQTRVCQRCARRVDDAAVEKYSEVMRVADKKLDESVDIFRLFAMCESVAHSWDLTRIQLAERAMRTALDTGQVEQFLAVGQSVRDNYEAFFHPNSSSLGLYMAKMAKAAFFVGEVKTGSEFLKKALLVGKLTFGEDHPYFRNLLQFGPTSYN